VVFQRGHNRGEYERALPDLMEVARLRSAVDRESDYMIVRRRSDAPFDVEKSAQLELEWWIVHRERDRRDPGDLARALAGLQAEIYLCPQDRLVAHAKARAEAMLIRDTRAADGGVTEPDWERIGVLLDASWVSLQTAVSQPR
jgi:hypothetical protein